MMSSSEQYHQMRLISVSSKFFVDGYPQRRNIPGRLVSQVARCAEQRITCTGVIWDNLHVIAPVEAEKPVATVGNSLLSLLNPKNIGHLLKGTAPNQVDKVILNRFNGVAKPGEMILVLGRPGSGCSTFLKTVTLQTPDGLKVRSLRALLIRG